MSLKTVIVTAASSFIGSTLVGSLLKITFTKSLENK